VVQGLHKGILLQLLQTPVYTAATAGTSAAAISTVILARQPTDETWPAAQAEAVCGACIRGLPTGTEPYETSARMRRGYIQLEQRRLQQHAGGARCYQRYPQRVRQDSYFGLASIAGGRRTILAGGPMAGGRRTILVGGQ
jgi:hypothetical protein